MEDDETAGAAEGRLVGEAAPRALLLLPGGARASRRRALATPLPRGAAHSEPP